jgi:hypothetical protein
MEAGIIFYASLVQARIRSGCKLVYRSNGLDRNGIYNGGHAYLLVS